MPNKNYSNIIFKLLRYLRLKNLLSSCVSFYFCIIASLSLLIVLLNSIILFESSVLFSCACDIKLALSYILVNLIFTSVNNAVYLLESDLELFSNSMFLLKAVYIVTFILN